MSGDNTNRTTVWIARIPASGTGGLCAGDGRAGGSATPPIGKPSTARAGVEAVNAPTFHPDHSVAWSDFGPICSCFAGRRTSIADAARAGAHDVDAVKAELKADTNCGSFQPEISRIISDVTLPQGVRIHVDA